MKSIFAFVAALFISFNVFATNSGEASLISIQPIGETAKFALRYENAKSEKVSIKIYDTQNNLVHNERIEKETTTQRIYDLSQIGAGTYTVVIVDGDLKETHTVTVGEQIGENNFTATLFPSVNQDKIYAYISENNDIVTLQLKDEKGNILYSEDITTTSADRILNTTKLPTGYYTLEVVGGTKTATQSYFVR